MRIALAILACVCIVLIYALISVGLGWRNGGGIIPMLILFLAIGGTWKGITGSDLLKKFPFDSQPPVDPMCAKMSSASIPPVEKPPAWEERWTKDRVEKPEDFSKPPQRLPQETIVVYFWVGAAVVAVPLLIFLLASGMR